MQSGTGLPEEPLNVHLGRQTPSGEQSDDPSAEAVLCPGRERFEDQQIESAWQEIERDVFPASHRLSMGASQIADRVSNEPAAEVVGGKRLWG